MGIGPTRPAWKAGILPLNYTRISSQRCLDQQRLYIIPLNFINVKYFYRFFVKIFLNLKNFYFFVILSIYYHLFASPKPYPPVIGSLKSGISGGKNVKTTNNTAMQTSNTTASHSHFQFSPPRRNKKYSNKHPQATATKKNVIFSQSGDFPNAPL